MSNKEYEGTNLSLLLHMLIFYLIKKLKIFKVNVANS